MFDKRIRFRFGQRPLAQNLECNYASDAFVPARVCSNRISIINLISIRIEHFLSLYLLTQCFSTNSMFYISVLGFSFIKVVHAVVCSLCIPTKIGEPCGRPSVLYLMPRSYSYTYIRIVHINKFLGLAQSLSGVFMYLHLCVWYVFTCYYQIASVFFYWTIFIFS